MEKRMRQHEGCIWQRGEDEVVARAFPCKKEKKKRGKSDQSKKRRRSGGNIPATPVMVDWNGSFAVCLVTRRGKKALHFFQTKGDPASADTKVTDQRGREGGE